MSSRCIVCNRVMQPEEIVWKPDIGQHETHCSSCLQKHSNEDFDTVISWNEDDYTEST